MARKGKKKRGARVRISPWWFAGAGAVAVVAVLAYAIATSGDSGSSGPGRVTASPDPRVAGLTPVQTLQLEAGGSDVDAYFNPTTLSGPAGEAIEIVIENTGSLSHNLTVSGLDGEYDTADDWESDPVLILPGEEGTLVLKIDEAGTYPFQCSLHPLTQFGELVLQ